MVIYGYPWLSMVILGYPGLYVVMYGYPWLSMVILGYLYGYPWLCGARSLLLLYCTEGYKKLFTVWHH